MQTYRGSDRRRTDRPEAPAPFGWSYLVAAAILGTLTILAIAEIGAPGDPGDLGLPEMLGVAAASLAFVTGSLEIARWRVAGGTAPLWSAAAAFAAGAMLTGRCVLPAVAELDAGVVGAATWASAVAFVGLGLHAARGPAVDLRISPRSVALTAVAPVLVLTPLFLLFDLELRNRVDPSPGVGGRIGLTAVWLVLGAAYTARSQREHTWAPAWFGLFSLSLAATDAVSAVGLRTDQPLGAIAMTIPVVGALCAVLGAERGLQATFDAQAHELGDTRAEISAVDRHAKSLHAAAAERAHEARNALAAIDGAIRTLEQYRDRLPPETQAQLSAGVASEIGRLQRLVDLDEKLEAPVLFVVRDSIMPAVTRARTIGLDVAMQIPSDLVAFGGPKAVDEVVENLLANVQRHAAGSRAELEARADGQRIVVTVADRGPGVPADRRAAIFEARGSRDGAGRGLGLYLSRRIVRAHGGELWIDERPGGGALFSFHVEAAPSRAVFGLPLVDDIEQVRHREEAGLV